MWAGASPELGKKRARGTRNYSFSGRSEDYTEMTLKALRDLADKTPGITNRKKVGKKRVYKEKEELVGEVKELKAKKVPSLWQAPRLIWTRGWPKKLDKLVRSTK